jgi:transcription antitermination factor NusG
MQQLNDRPVLEIERAPQWYAVQTRSRFEKVVEAEFQAKGINSYLPLLAEIHQWKDRKKRVEQPVFPGYVFARFVDDPWMQLRVLRTHGAVRILGGARSIEPIPDHQVENIRRVLLSTEKCFAHPFLQEGSRVRVKRGPLKDVEGLLIRIKNRTRLVLSINLLSQSVATEIDINDAELLHDPKGPFV